MPAQTELRVAGLGGQGVILSAMIIGRAASIHAGRYATLIQAFGPEARGSACSAQVIVSDEPIGYPYVRALDLLVVMSQDAYEKFLPELKPDGMLLYESELVPEPTGLGPGRRMAGIPATRLAEEIGRRMVMNIVMTGFFAGVTGLLPPEAVEKAVRESVPAGTEDLNLMAFRRGLEYGVTQVR
jgi:2-oxoglutarate ferredoxin oxidoreductase subunit gamma